MSALTTKPFNDVGGTVSTLRRLVAAPARLSSLFGPVLARALTLRHGRPWLALVVVPLGMVAVTMALPLWWDVPLALLTWWWAPAADPWSWLLGVMEGIVGVVWAYVGVDLLAAEPQDSFIVGLPWVAFAVILFLMGVMNRVTARRRYGW